MYNTLITANAYFLTRLDSDVWTQASDTHKTQALSTACRLIERLNFACDKTVSTQTREFPRGTDTTVPQAILDAENEIAIALLDGRNVEYEAEHANRESTSMGGARSRLESEFIRPEKVHNIPSTVAWSLLQPFLRDGGHVKVSRVS